MFVGPNIYSRSGSNSIGGLIPVAETVSIYVPLFRTGSLEALLKFIIVLQKIIKVQDLSTRPQKYRSNHNLLLVKALQVFE